MEGTEEFVAGKDEVGECLSVHGPTIVYTGCCFSSDKSVYSILPCSPQQVASDRVRDNFATKNPKLCLAGLGIDTLPDALCTTSRVTHVTMLNLKNNNLQLLPSELFLCLTQLEEVDVSKVSERTNLQGNSEDSRGSVNHSTESTGCS